MTWSEHVNGVISGERQHGGVLQRLYVEIIKKKSKASGSTYDTSVTTFQTKSRKNPTSISSEQHFCCNVCYPGSDSSPGH